MNINQKNLRSGGALDNRPERGGGAHEHHFFAFHPTLWAKAFMLFCSVLFRHEEICPALDKFQPSPITLLQLRQYRLISGHLDWALLDGGRWASSSSLPFLVQVCIVDTIFLFFSPPKSCDCLMPNMINLPEYQGLRAEAPLSLDDYFCAGPRMPQVFY